MAEYAFLFDMVSKVGMAIFHKFWVKEAVSFNVKFIQSDLNLKGDYLLSFILLNYREWKNYSSIF